ncbi:hypothetical protein PybrP1_010376 [[Pythium] brassicae (nom. inval.)]|nr:hypothetical protein PybrP1_010376 [[Pythium] brassicae (nom. inval.)]
MNASSAPPADQLAAMQRSVVVRFRNLLVALAIGYGVFFLLSALLVAYMRRNRSVAFRGDASAARKILLPAFVPLLLLLSAVSFAFTSYFCAALLFTEVTVTASKVVNEAYYAGRLFLVVVPMMFMLQKSVTTPALLRAAALSVLLCTYSLPVVWYTSAYCSPAVAYYVPTLARLPVPLLFAWACVSPPARASQRSIREYCVFVFVYYALFAYQAHTTASTGGTFRMSSVENVWSALQTPVVEAPARNAMTVRGTADYMAPEIIQGRAGTAMYFEAADVYSLAVTLWDIAHPLAEKFPDTNGNHFQIFESVLSGKRPPISSACHPEVARILGEAWDAQPDKRPSAQSILSRLEALKQEVVSDVAAALAESVERKVVVTKKETTTEKSVTGQLLMQRMLEFGFVESVDEACRMGNGLMSAGFLHHVRHLEPFTTSAELFVFDEAMVESFTAHALDKLHLPPLSLDEAALEGIRVAKLAQQQQKTTRRGGSYQSTSSSVTVLGERHRLSSASSSKTSAQTTHESPYLRRTGRDECSCSKLGRGQGILRAHRKRFRRTNKKWFAVAEGGNVLTEKLLMDALEHTGESTFDDTHSPMNNSDLEAAILHDSGGDDDEEDDDDACSMELSGGPMNSSIAASANATVSAVVSSNVTAAVVDATAEAQKAAKAAAAAKMHALMTYLTHKIYVLQLFLLLGYGIMFALCVVLICYMRYNRNVAFKGDANAARKILLPAFEPLLWILGTTTGTYTVFFCIALATDLYEARISKLATERTVAVAFVLSTYTLPIVWYMVTYEDPKNLYAVLTLSRALLLLLYTYVLVRPPGRATPRTIREYCLFAYIYYALLFTYNEMFQRGKTDLGFSLTLPRDIVVQNAPPTGNSSNGASGRTSSTTEHQLQQMPPSSSPRASKSIAAQMTVRGTVDYMAPEIIKGKAGVALYGEAADVYALAITMWDILHPGAEKFPQLRNNHLLVFEFVVDGKRPEFTNDVHQSLREVIASAWHPDPRLRPSAQNVVSILESIQEEVQAAFASQLSFEISPELSRYGAADKPAIERAFSGESAIDRMLELEFVTSVGEGVRIGNALMDAGLMHHVKHARCFENGDPLYFFDDDNIQLCQPYNFKAVPVLGGSCSDDHAGAMNSSYALTEQDDTSTTISGVSTRRSRHASNTVVSDPNSGSQSHSGAPLLENGGMCACRKFGQRLEVAKTSRRRFRRNHQKFKAIAEENLLTTKLLTSKSEADFDGFDAVTGGSVTAA